LDLSTVKSKKSKAKHEVCALVMTNKIKNCCHFFFKYKLAAVTFIVFEYLIE